MGIMSFNLHNMPMINFADIVNKPHFIYEKLKFTDVPECKGKIKFTCSQHGFRNKKLGMLE